MPPASGSNSCARVLLVSAGWPLLAMSGIPSPYWRSAAARTLGLEVISLEVRRGEDIVPAFEALNGRAEALYVVLDPLTNTYRIRINTLALAARLPTMHGSREFVEAAGLM